MRRYSSGTGDRSADSARLARSPSISGVTDETIKSVTHRFDHEIVFKLQLVGKALPRISGLDRCINLVELNLAGNQITKIEGLDNALQLRRLILSNNSIARIEGIWHLQQLEGLWLQGNRIAAADALSLEQLATLPALRALYLQNLDRSQQNPVCRQPSYKASVLAALPTLSNLDAERSPRDSQYMEASAEAEAWRASPPAPPELVLPEVVSWLEGVSMELAGGAGGPAEEELQQRTAGVVKALDECEILAHVLQDELGKWRRQVEAQ